jgi:hypothetical protein
MVIIVIHPVIVILATRPIITQRLTLRIPNWVFQPPVNNAIPRLLVGNLQVIPNMMHFHFQYIRANTGVNGAIVPIAIQIQVITVLLVVLIVMSIIKQIWIKNIVDKTVTHTTVFLA